MCMCLLNIVFPKRKLAKQMKIDLRMFREMTLSDTFDGRGIACDGNTHYMLFYNGRCVYQRITVKCDGSTESRRQYGDKCFFYRQMHEVANAFLTIGDNILMCLNASTPPAHKSEKSIYLDEELYNVLINHPQYIALKKDLSDSTTCPISFSIQKMSDDNEYKIIITQKETGTVKKNQ